MLLFSGVRKENDFKEQRKTFIVAIQQTLIYKSCLYIMYTLARPTPYTHVHRRYIHNSVVLSRIIPYRS